MEAWVIAATSSNEHIRLPREEPERFLKNDCFNVNDLQAGFNSACVNDRQMRKENKRLC